MKGNRLKSRDRYLEEAMLFRDTDLIKVITGVFGAIEPPKAVRRAFWDKNKNSKLRVRLPWRRFLQGSELYWQHRCEGYSKGIHVCDRNDNRQSKKGSCSSGSDACGHRGDCRRRIILRS